jgi:pimeloyl-ACP methyl ester carboxylesterase
MRADPTHHAAIRLASGRRLSYSIAGPAYGTPVIYCHGAIGTPVDRAVNLEALTAELDVRQIAVNRPGIGASDGAPGRSVLDFAADIRELADALGLERFSIVGVSAGGPYALAIARELPERVERVAVCSSLSPLAAPHLIPGIDGRIRIALGLLACAPRTWGLIGDALLPVIRRHPGLITRVIAAHAARAERERVLRPEEQAAACSSFLDAASFGVRGMIDDYLTCCSEWGFSPAEVQAEVHLWHGAGDPLVPVEHALQLAIALPRCRIFIDADEGHHFFRSRLKTILATLVSNGDEGSAPAATSLDDARSLARDLHRRSRRSSRGAQADQRWALERLGGDRA